MPIANLARQLNTPRGLQTDVGTEGDHVSFDGTEAVTIPITGVLKFKNGGTGKDSFEVGSVVVVQSEEALDGLVADTPGSVLISLQTGEVPIFVGYKEQDEVLASNPTPAEGEPPVLWRKAPDLREVSGSSNSFGKFDWRGMGDADYKRVSCIGEASGTNMVLGSRTSGDASGRDPYFRYLEAQDLPVNNTGKSGVLRANTGARPSYGQVTLTTDVVGILPIANGGTGKSAAPSLITNLGSTAGASPYDASPRPGVTGTLPVANGGTGQTTLAAVRNSLGLGNTTAALPVVNGGTGQTTLALARNAMGLGNTTAALPIANGGTGQTTVAAARNALGLGNTAGALPLANGGLGSACTTQAQAVAILRAILDLATGQNSASLSWGTYGNDTHALVAKQGGFAFA
jgi:hypothetical protein